MVGDENKAALADVVRAEEATGRVGRLVTYRGLSKEVNIFRSTGARLFSA